MSGGWVPLATLDAVIAEVAQLRAAVEQRLAGVVVDARTELETVVWGVASVEAGARVVRERAVSAPAVGRAHVPQLGEPREVGEFTRRRIGWGWRNRGRKWV